MPNIKVTLVREALPQDVPPGLQAGFALGSAVEELMLNVDLRDDVTLYALNIHIDGKTFAVENDPEEGGWHVESGGQLIAPYTVPTPEVENLR